MKKETHTKYILFLGIIIGVSLVLGKYAYAAFTDPACAPPGCNIDPPVFLQSATPGVAQTGHINLTGSIQAQLGTKAQTTVPTSLPSGISYQQGVGSGDPYGWTYPYGVKLSVIEGLYRNFELASTYYPGGMLAFRQFRPATSDWEPWRTLVMESTGGNVGIGIDPTGGTIPAETLEVKAKTGNVTRVRVTDMVTNPEFQLQYAGASHWAMYVDRADANKLKFWQGSNYLTIQQTNGNVGIGNTSPAYKLDVTGTINASVDVCGGGKCLSGGITGGGINNKIPVFTGASSVGSSILTQSGSPNIIDISASEPAFSFTSGSVRGYVAVASSVGSYSNFSSVGDFVMRSETGNLILTARNSTGVILFGTGAADTEKARITSSGQLVVKGDIQLAGGLSVPGAGENLKIIRGLVNSAGGINSGGGYTITKMAQGVYRVNFNSFFGDVPSVVATAMAGGGGQTIVNLCAAEVRASASNYAEVDTVCTSNGDQTWTVNPTDTPFSFIAVGAR